MNDLPDEQIPPAAAEVAGEGPRGSLAGEGGREVAKVAADKGKMVEGRAEERRDFFGEAVRELLRPLSGIIERKINPLLAALEQIPEEAERLAEMNFGLLDQPRGGGPRLAVHPSEAGPGRYLRPPGAMTMGGDGGFESVCSQCGKCVEACPVEAIKLDSGGLAGEGFPYIVAEGQPCVVCAELACMKSCPTGALRLVERLAIRMGTAEVDPQQCLRDHGEGCTLCVDVCPVDGKSEGGLAALFISAETGRIRVRKNVCIGCGMCENRCPTEPRAIVVRPHVEPEEPIVA